MDSSPQLLSAFPHSSICTRLFLNFHTKWTSFFLQRGHWRVWPQKWHPHRRRCPSTLSMVRANPTHPSPQQTDLLINILFSNRSKKHNRWRFYSLPLHPPSTLHLHPRQLQNHHPLHLRLYCCRNRWCHVLSRPPIGLGSHGSGMGEMGCWSLFLAEYVVAILDLGCGSWGGV